VSDKQRAANKANAQRSTGPKTAEGKARSSQNAIKHGQWAIALYPVLHGVLKEDLDEFDLAASDLVASLAPRDGLERQQARVVQAAFRRLQRLDSYEAASLHSAGHLPAELRSVVGDPVRLRYLGDTAVDLLTILESDLDQTDEEFIDLESALGDPDQDDELDETERPVTWKTLASFLRFHGPTRKITVKGLWTDELTPDSPEEWRKAYRSLFHHHWQDDREAARRWVHTKWLELRLAEGEARDQELSRGANQALNGVLDQASKLRQRALAELDRALTTYAQLQARELAGGGETRNEPI
jgi:hypothetical protein